MKKCSLLLLGIALLCFSCKEEEDIVGISLQTNSDTVYVDTLTDIFMYSVIEDSLPCRQVSHILLGEVDDPMFGNVKSDIFAQFRLSANAIDFGEGAVLDSVVLALPYAGFFGDTLQSVQLGVYELSEKLYKDTTYYTNQTLDYYPTNLVAGGNSFLFYPRSSVVLEGESGAAQLRIPLNNDFFTTRFLEKSGSSELATNLQFLEYFKGIVVKSEGKSGNGCLAYFNLLSTDASITLYFHNNDNDSLSFRLISNDSTNFFAHIEHQYISALPALQAQLKQKDYSGCGESVFLQAGCGVKARVQFPCLDRYEGKKIAIHKAEFILSRAETDAYKPYFAPSSLTMYYKKDSNLAVSYYMPDYLKFGSSYFGGAVDTADYSYRFLLTNYVQQVLMGTFPSDYPLYVVIGAAVIQATRLQLVGPSSTTYPDRRMKLVLTYSLILD